MTNEKIMLAVQLGEEPSLRVLDSATHFCKVEFVISRKNLEWLKQIAKICDDFYKEKGNGNEQNR